MTNSPAEDSGEIIKARIRENMAPRKLDMRRLDTVRMKAIDWMWLGWIPQGYVTIWAGETGTGKTTLLTDLAARVTTGKPWPGEPEDQTRNPANVLWLGSEDGIEEMTAPRFHACGADLSRISEIRGVIQGSKRDTFSLQDDIAGVVELLRTAKSMGTPVALLVIDPITSYLPGQRLRKVDLNDAGQLRSILEPWMIVAQEHSLAIVCVTHFAKDTNRTMLNRVVGSAAFAQTCRSLCAVVAQPEDGPHSKVLVQVKVNLPDRPEGAWKFHTKKVELGIDRRNSKTIAATVPVWDRLDALTTPESLTRETRGPSSKRPAVFGIWLQQHFSDVPDGEAKPATAVKAAALNEAGISERWWAENSPVHLSKENRNGVWFCWPKQKGS